MLEADPELAWASPALELFGARAASGRPAPFSAYRQLFENQSDAGTLFRRAVFDGGLRYAEELPAFEDWEFFLEAALAGFRGVPAGRCGFRYRRRADSMLTRARSGPSDSKPRSGRATRRVRAGGAGSAASTPRRRVSRSSLRRRRRAAHRRLRSRAAAAELAEFADTVAAAGRGEPAPAGHIPAVTLLTTAAAIEGLEAAGCFAETRPDPGRAAREVGLRSAPGARV